MDSESDISTRSAGSGSPPKVPDRSGSGSQAPTYDSRRTRADRRWLMASRVVMVAR